MLASLLLARKYVSFLEGPSKEGAAEEQGMLWNPAKMQKAGGLAQLAAEDMLPFCSVKLARS